MKNNNVKNDLSYVHGCISANVKEKGGKITGKGGDMLSGVPIAKSYLMEAIVLKGQISHPKQLVLN